MENTSEKPEDRVRLTNPTQPTGKVSKCSGNGTAHRKLQAPVGGWAAGLPQAGLRGCRQGRSWGLPEAPAGSPRAFGAFTTPPWIVFSLENCLKQGGLLSGISLLKCLFCFSSFLLEAWPGGWTPGLCWGPCGCSQPACDWALLASCPKPIFGKKRAWYLEKHSCWGEMGL